MFSREDGRSKRSPESRAFGLDDILVEIGQFGKFQFCFFLLAFIFIIFNTTLQYGFVFTSSPVVYRCRVPECDESQSLMYEKPWIHFSIPKNPGGHFEKCQRYTLNSTNDQKSCSAESYDRKVGIDCGNDFIFRDGEVTISNEFEIFCSDEWKLSMVGTLGNLGQFLGIPLGGFFSDRYGCTKVLAFGGFLSAITGLVRSFSPSYFIFTTLIFLDNLFSSTIYGTVFVLALEIIGPKFRIRFGSLLRLCAGFSKFLLAVVAKTYPNWRLIERIFYIPALAFVILPWILPESLRWLLSQGEEEKAVLTLKNAARINKRKLSDFSIGKLLASNRERLSLGEEKKQSHLREAFKIFPRRIINCSLCWFANVFLFYGFTLNSVLLGGNKYNNFMYISLIEIPGTILAFLTINRYGRRFSLFGYLLMTGICVTVIMFVRPDHYNLKLMLNLLGKMLITASSHTLYVFTSEIFPTNARSGLFAFCLMIGRIGSMVAPQMSILETYSFSAPTILLASSAFLSSYMVLTLPETNDEVTPITLQVGDKIEETDVNIEMETKEKHFVTNI
ncbi:organic cation transporter-like protein [Episyrphus balteatus]|uniref:organic cation transporter-like protein n=1 Tax=Episyrphus balteatus TaxID=286459 RepID=UPI002486BCC7|nr:organic cation transporter-like protein [Episyrphus balteatus]